jgi:Histidine kinase-, DNA gyrase B-, and HSP90-like ATPase
MSHLQHEMFRKTSRPKAMSVSVEGERVEEEQNATLALLEARSREELAKALLGIALQRSRASAGAVLFSENGRFVPFATSIWAKNAVRDVRFSSSRFALDIGAFEHAARMPVPIPMNEVLSRFDGIELSVLWIPLRYQGDIVGLIYLEADRAGSFGATSIESVGALAIHAATVLANLRSSDDLAREIGLHAEASRDQIYDPTGELEVLAKGAQANLSFFGIDGVILEVLGGLRDELEKSSISVRADIDEGLPELRGDRVQLQQVVFKLLRNGIDAMKDLHGRPRRLEISCRADDIEMIMAFRYCGDGSGTNTNDMNRLTRLFDPIVPTRDSGMSFGSFISRRIVEAYRGRIWVERDEDCGLTIRLALPL